MILGIIGSVIILIAWMFEAEEAIRKHRSLIDLKFAVMYAVATFMLAVYSYQVNDAVFFWFQIGLFVIIMFEIVYSIRIKKIHKA